MTVSTENSRDTFTFDGVTTVFPFTFRINEEDKSNIKLYENGVLMSASLYTIAVNPSGVGGTITFSSAPGAVAPDNTVGVAIRQLPYTQGFDIRDGEGFDEEAVENAFDKTTILTQQLKDLISRSLSLPIASSVSPNVDAPDTDQQVMYYDLATQTIKWTTVEALYAASGAGSGDIVCSAPSVVDSNLVSFDGTTGNVVKDSGIQIPSTASKKFFPVRVNGGATGLEYFDQTPTELEVNVSGVITPTKNIHTIATNGGAGTDDLVTIAATSVPVGHELTLKSDGSGDVVTVKTTDNIDTYDGNDFAIEDGYYLKLYWDGINWKEIGRFSAVTGTQVNSTESTPTAGGTITWAHGLGSAPLHFFSLLRCNAADAGYAVNDYLIPAQNVYDYQVSGGGQIIYATSTNVVFKNVGTYGIFLPHKTSFTHTALSMSKWRVTMVARG